MSIIRSNFLARQLLGRVGRDGAGVVDADVDAAEVLAPRCRRRAARPLPCARRRPPRRPCRRRPRSRRRRCTRCPGSLGCGSAVLASSTTLAPRWRRRAPTSRCRGCRRSDERAVSERGHGPPRVRSAMVVHSHFTQCHVLCTGFGPRASLLPCMFPVAVLAFSFFASTLSSDELPWTTSSDLLRHPAGARLRTGATAPATRRRRASTRSPAATSRPGTAARLWTFRQYSGFGTAEESNRRYRYLLDQGGTGLSVALDLPTQCGYDSDDPEYGEEVGRVGVAVDTLADAEILFDGIPLDKISTSFTINGTAAILLAFYVAAAEKTGRAAGEAHRHHPERHPQGVRLARHLDLAAGAVAAADRRHHRVLRGRGAQVQRDLGGRCALPRRRRQRRAGDGLHAGRRRHLLRHRGRARAG